MRQKQKYIISASKRTDIPAFYSEWFMNRIRAGYAMYRNPFNLNQGVKVSLKPNDILAICFWTRNPEPLMKHFEELKNAGINFYFHYTINNYPRPIDPSTPSAEKMIEVFKKISSELTPSHVAWRYDPILFSDSISIEWHINNFKSIASKLKGYTNRCYISFIDFYAKTNKKLNQLALSSNIRVYDKLETEGMILSLTESLIAIASENGIDLYYCNEKKLEEYEKANPRKGLYKASCVDFDLIQELFLPIDDMTKKTKRNDSCGCYPSKDIGAYDTCLYKCIYCYANTNFETKSFNRLLEHSSKSEYLIEEGTTPSIITDFTTERGNPTLFD